MRLRKEIREGIGRGIRNGVRRGRALLVIRTPKDTGMLKASWRDNTHRADAAMGRVAAEIFNEAPYAGIVESGARPHPVSAEGVAAITRWAQRHFPTFTPAEINRIVTGIVYKLRTHGQKATYFVRDSRQEIIQGLRAEIIRQLEMVAAGHKQAVP
jgi:hypothetical protein